MSYKALLKVGVLAGYFSLGQACTSLQDESGSEEEEEEGKEMPAVVPKPVALAPIDSVTPAIIKSPASGTLPEEFYKSMNRNCQLEVGFPVPLVQAVAERYSRDSMQLKKAAGSGLLITSSRLYLLQFSGDKEALRSELENTFISSGVLSIPKTLCFGLKPTPELYRLRGEEMLQRGHLSDAYEAFAAAGEQGKAGLEKLLAEQILR